MTTDRVFLHVDMDAFFAAVEQRDRPELKGKPVVVGAAPDQRGVVSAASYEARVYGIHSAMPSSEAGRRCPDAVYLPPDFARYEEASRQVFAIFERFTPLIEPLSIDEAFLDVTGVQRLHGTGPEIAAKIKAAIQKETQLTASVGVAPNKYLAKLASEMDKPDGLTVVPRRRAEITRFLAPLPVSAIWGVGKVTRQVLEGAGLHTIGDLQQCDGERLGTLLGKHSAERLRQLAFGEDRREIELEREEKSISREYTFPVDCTDIAQIERVLGDLVEDVGERLRAAGKYARVAHLKLRWWGFKTITRQKGFDEPSCDTFRLRAAAQQLLNKVELDKPVRLIGFGVSHFTEKPQQQLSLFDDTGPAPRRHETLSRTVDTIREQFGHESIGRAATLVQETKRKKRHKG